MKRKKPTVILWLILAFTLFSAYTFFKKENTNENDNMEDKAGTIVGGVKYPAKKKGFFEFTPWQWFGYDIRNLF